ncbi:MAG: hypothetical protein QOG22_1299, partial [Pseudonocardiales bacterium]|nr:hypothetical protein [Pseudonocardiales bacterium]
WEPLVSGGPSGMAGFLSTQSVDPILAEAPILARGAAAPLATLAL